MRNVAVCKQCGDLIESVHRHHFRSCSCGAISIDGGSDYRRSLGSRENFLRPTKQQLEEWDSKITGRLEKWDLWSGKLWGFIFDDKHQRFRDGEFVRTSPVVSPQDHEIREGVVVTTTGSRYLLGVANTEPKMGSAT